MFFNKRPPSICLPPPSLPGRGHRRRGAGSRGKDGAPGRAGWTGVPEEDAAGGGGESGSAASERRGGAGGRGHARQPSREAAAVSNTVAMATWPRGTGSGRNSSRPSPRRPAPPPASPLPRRPARARLRGRPRPSAPRPAHAPRGLPRAGVAAASAAAPVPPGARSCPAAR